MAQTDAPPAEYSEILQRNLPEILTVGKKLSGSALQALDTGFTRGVMLPEETRQGIEAFIGAMDGLGKSGNGFYFIYRGKGKYLRFVAFMIYYEPGNYANTRAWILNPFIALNDGISQAVQHAGDGNTPAIFAYGKFEEHLMLFDQNDPFYLIGTDCELSFPYGPVVMADIDEFTLIANVRMHGINGLNGGAINVLDANMMFLLNEISDNTSATTGGGVMCNNIYGTYTTVLMLNHIHNNHAPRGGGISFVNDSGTVALANIIKDNTANENGGGVYVWAANSFILANYIEGNRTLDPGSDGGGVSMVEPVQTILAGNYIRNNSAPRQGGGLHLKGKTGMLTSMPRIALNYITHNHTPFRGGGIAVDQNGPGIFLGNYISDNTSVYGAGISCWESSPSFFANILTQNAAGDSSTPGQGGGFYLHDFEGILAGNQVMGNTANSGGGIHYETSGSKGTWVADISLNRIAENTARLGAGLFMHGDNQPGLLMNTIRDNAADSMGGGLFLSGGSSPSLTGNNIMRNTATGPGGGAYVYGPGTDPVFGSTGITSTAPNSFQSNEALLGGAIYYTDQANPSGASGMYYGNKALKGGAVYCDAPGGSWERNTFDWNIARLNGGAIFVQQGMSPVLRGNTFTRNIGGAQVMAKAPGDEASKNPSGNGGAVYVGGIGADPLITGNFFEWNVSYTGHGAALALEDGARPEVNHNVYQENIAGYLSQGYGRGGGIYVSACNLMISDEVFSTNVAHQGGAIAIESGSLDTLLRNTFLVNIADKDTLDTGMGGACYVQGTDTRVVIGRAGEPNAFKYNTSAFGGAVAATQAAVLSMQNDTFTANQAGYFSGTGDGGALFLSAGATAQVGGNAPDGVGNLFEQNVAGLPGKPGLANGGAIAVHGPASVQAQGNVFRKRNSCSHNGGAIYLQGEDAFANIGGENDDDIIRYPFSDTMLGNIIQNNNLGFIHPVQLPLIPWPQDSILWPDTLDLDSLIGEPVFPDTLVPDTDIVIITYDPVTALEVDYSSPLNRYAWVTQGSAGLLCVDVSNPGLFVVLDTIPSLDRACGLSMGPGLMLYLADGSGGVRVVDAGAIHAGLPPSVVNTFDIGVPVLDVVALHSSVVALAADSSAYLVSPGAAGPVILDTLKEAGLDWLDGATDQSRQIYVHATSLGDFTQLRAYQVGPAGFVERGSLDIDGRVSDMTINDSLLMVCSNHALADTNTGMLRVFVLPDTGGIQMYPVFPPYLEKGTYYTSIAAEWPEIFIGANDGQIIMDANTFAINFQPTYRPILDLAPTTLFSTTVACGNPALMTLSPPAGGMMGELPGLYTEDTLAIPWPDNYDFPGDSNWAYDIPPLPDTLNIHGEAYFLLEDTVIHEKSAVQASIAAVGHSPGKFVPDTSLAADDEPVRTMNGGFLAVVDSAQTYTVGNLIGGTAWVDANTARWFGGGVYVRNGGDTICIGDYIEGYAGNHTLRNYFLGNAGRWGGAVAVGEHSAQPVRITNNIVGGGGPREGNLARSRGGGIYAQGSRLEVKMNSILGNFAGFDTASVDTAFGFGGGLAILGSSAVVENNWVARNRSSGNAGGVGIITGGGPLSLLHNTLTENNGLVNAYPGGPVMNYSQPFDRFTQGLGDEVYLGKPDGGPLNDSCLIRGNIIDHIGSFEASGLFADTLMRGDSLMLKIGGNLLRSVLAKPVGGAFATSGLIAANQEGIPVYTDPDIGNYSLASGSPFNGMGWNPSSGSTVWGNAEHSVPGNFATISAALAAADPGDRIIVYTSYDGQGETFPLKVPPGVMLTGTAFGDTLNLEMTDSTLVADTSGGPVLVLEGRGCRTLIAGLKFLGKDSVLRINDAAASLVGNIFTSNDTAINRADFSEDGAFGFSQQLFLDHNTFVSPLWMHYDVSSRHETEFSAGDPSRVIPGPLFGYNIIKHYVYAADTILPVLAYGEELNNRYALRQGSVPADLAAQRLHNPVPGSRRFISADPAFAAPGQQDLRLLRGSPCLLGLDSTYCIVLDGECLFGFDSVCTCERMIIQGTDTLFVTDTFQRCMFHWDTAIYSWVIGAQYGKLTALMRADTDFACAPFPATLWVEDEYAVPGDSLYYTWFLSNGDTLLGDSLSYLLESSGTLGALLRAVNRYSVMHFRKDSLIYADAVAVNVGPDTMIADTQAVQLGLNVTSGLPPFLYSWSPAEGLSDTTLAQPIANPWRTTVYRVSVTDTLGCRGSDSLIISVVPTLGHLDGSVVYQDIMQTAIAFAGVVLADSSGNVLDTLWCDADGRFRIGYLEAGEYGLQPLVNLPWGGGNATDALLVMRHFVHLDTLAPLYALAADVDISGLVNATDALQIARRFASLMPAFASGDWLLPEQRINIEAGYYSLSLSVVCFGDVNGSYGVKAVMMKD